MFTRKEDEEIITLVYENLAAKNGPESWQLKDYLEKNKDKLGIENVRDQPKNVLKPTMTDDKDTLELDLARLRNTDLANKVRLTTKNEPDLGKSTSISADLANVKDPKVARQIISKFMDVVFSAHLQFQPGGSELKLYTGGLGKWNELCKTIEKEKCQQYAGRFQERGIKLSIDDIPMILHPDAKQPEQDKKRANAWDVPHGAPDAKPKRGG